MPKNNVVIAKRITVTMSGDKLFEIMLPNANDPAMNAEKHSIARWPLNSEVMNSVYSAAKTLGLFG